MAYLLQTFTIGQVLTAAQMNYVEANIRDHQHGVAGVSSSGMTFASPVFTTQITTPKIVTASGNLEITPAGGNVGIGTATPGEKLEVAGGLKITSGSAGSYSANTLLVDATGGNARFFSVGPDGATKGGYLFQGVASDGAPNDTHVVITPTGNVGIGATPAAKFQVTNTTQQVFDVSTTANYLAFYKDLVPTYVGAIGNNVPGGALQEALVFSRYSGGWAEQMRITSGGNVGIGTPTPSALLSVGSTSQFQVNSSGVVAAGTVPLARMKRTEVVGYSTTADIQLDLGTVVTGDRILVSADIQAVLALAGTLQLRAYKLSGTAVIDLGDSNVITSTNDIYNASTNLYGNLSSIFRVTTGGTLIIVINHQSIQTINSRTLSGLAIVLNNG